eukprot:COSAG01_NODE_527_length_15894_cov_55.365622_4_plen_152_part_00
MAASSATGMSAICTIAHKPASDPAVPAEDQLAVQKGDVVEVLHQNFDTQWWECRFARKASPGEVWDARVHSKKGLLPSGNLLVTLRPPDLPSPPPRPSPAAPSQHAAGSHPTVRQQRRLPLRNSPLMPQVLQNFINIDLIAKFEGSNDLVT